MDRSFAARSPAGRRRGIRSSGLPPGAPAARWGALAAGSRRSLRTAFAALRTRRRLRIAAIGLALALPLLGGGWLWLRHSSLVAVEHVTITGVHGPEAHAIDIALSEAAKGMSTLDVKPAALQAAVARFPAVGVIRALPSFPHGLRIEVSQLPAVAALLAGATRTALSGSGTVLGPSLLSSSLPTVADDVAPGTGSHLRNPLVLQALTVLGAAPPSLDRLAAKAYFGPRGLTVAMRNGMLVYFGDANRPHAKWLALASVLADSSSTGATYVDVRLPGRPAAGFPPGTGPSHASEGATGETAQGSSESAVSALAARLAAASPEAAKKREGSEKETKEAEGSEATHSGEASEAAEGGTGASAASGAETGGATGTNTESSG